MIADHDFNERLSFLAEWFDYEAAYHKKFLLNFYPSDNTVELFDRDLNRTFLKRSMCEKVNYEDMYVGNTVRMYGRQIKITDYADCRTKNLIGKTHQRTFALVKPSAVDRIGEIINQIQDRQFHISKMVMAKLSQAEALELYKAKRGDAFLPFVVDHVSSGLIVAMELVGDDAVERWKRTVGPTDPYQARKEAPESLRAIYGAEKASNAFHAAENCEEALTEAKYFFSEEDGSNKAPKAPLILDNTTCCVIKPHAINEGKLGCIVNFITQSKFRITSMRTFYLSNANAEEFLEVYKGVIGDFQALMLSFLDGPCVALEIAGKNESCQDIHGEFRKFVGPHDSDIARQIRPDSLRARFGLDKYQNAVHCTDLPNDTVLELEYFFKILS